MQQRPAPFVQLAEEGARALEDEHFALTAALLGAPPGFAQRRAPIRLQRDGESAFAHVWPLAAVTTAMKSSTRCSTMVKR